MKKIVENELAEETYQEIAKNYRILEFEGKNSEEIMKASDEKMKEYFVRTGEPDLLVEKIKSMERDFQKKEDKGERNFSDQYLASFQKSVHPPMSIAELGGMKTSQNGPRINARFLNESPFYSSGGFIESTLINSKPRFVYGSGTGSAQKAPNKDQPNQPNRQTADPIQERIRHQQPQVYQEIPDGDKTPLIRVVRGPQRERSSSPKENPQSFQYQGQEGYWEQAEGFQAISYGPKKTKVGNEWQAEETRQQMPGLRNVGLGMGRGISEGGSFVYPKSISGDAFGNVHAVDDFHERIAMHKNIEMLGGIENTISSKGTQYFH